jgi:hypothetical protein
LKRSDMFQLRFGAVNQVGSKEIESRVRADIVLGTPPITFVGWYCQNGCNLHCKISAFDLTLRHRYVERLVVKPRD